MFSDKNNIICNKRIATTGLQRLANREDIKLILIHASVIYQILWIHWI